MSNVTIKVTRKCIEDGRPRSGNACPIALALRSAGCITATVSAHEANFYTRGSGHLWRRLPARAKGFVRNFDAGLPVKPFSFVLKGVKMSKEKK